VSHEKNWLGNLTKNQLFTIFFKTQANFYAKLLHKINIFFNKALTDLIF